MRKIILLTLCASCSLFLFWKFTKADRIAPVQDSFVRIDGVDESEREDGIRLAQEQDFQNTKDIRLGYIPQDRLIKTTERLLQSRRLNRGMNINALNWTERGSNSDATGPSNGNTRANSGVTSGRVRAIWVDLTDATNKTVWVGGIDGGLWKTTDITASPATWIPVNDFMGNLAIGSICQDPVNKNIMYVGTGEKTINADAVRGGGVWKSTDFGATWSLLANTVSFWNVSKIACDASSRVYVATMGNGAGLERSVNGGTNWTDITPTGLNTAITDMKISSTGRMHIICGYYSGWFNAGVAGYRFSDDFGTAGTPTWTAATVGFGNPTYNCELGVSGNTLYALNSNSSYQTTPIYKSTDGGVNWATTATSPPAASGTNDLSSGQAWYNIAVAVDPVTPNNVIVGGLNCYRSTDGGATWTQASTWVGTSGQYVHADQQFSVWNGNQVLVSSDGGIFYSGDGGVTFRDRNVGLRLKQFYACAIHPTTTNYFLAGAQDNGVHQLTNAGLGSSIEVTGGDGAFVHIDQDEPQYQFGSYVFNQYRRSTDGGATWSSVNYSSSAGQFINPSDYDDGNNKLYAAGIAGQYTRWENPQTGSTFTPVTIAAFNSVKVNHVMVSPFTSNRVFFGTVGGRVVRVDNADQASPTATNITGSGMSASSVSCVAVGTDENNLIAAFSNYGANHVWMSTTGGGTSAWTNITGNLPDIPVRWAMFYPYDNTKAILATEAGIWETNFINGASTVWTQNTSFPIVRVDMLQYRTSDNTVVAATHGRGLWTSVIPVSTPYIQFANSYVVNTETNSATSTCRRYKDYTVNMTIAKALTGNATATLAATGSATTGADFDFTTNGSFVSPSAAVTFASGSSTPQTVTIRIYDDADVEPTEAFTLSYTVSGVTDAQAGPSNQLYIFTINDNDVAPVPPGGSSTATIGAGGFAGLTQPFRGNYEKARSQFIYLASELTSAGFIAGNITALGMNVTSKTSTLPYNGLTISLKNTTTSSYASLAFETGVTSYYTANYSTVAGMNTFNLSSPFAWDGTSNLVVEICYDNTTGSFSGTGDVVSAHSTTDDKGLWNRANTGTGCSLSVGFSQFSSTYVRPDLTITGASGTNIETVLNSNKTEYVGNNGNYYFFNSTGTIISKISGASANLGCVTTTLLEAGNTWQAFSGGQRSQKVFTITPSANAGSTYTVGLYFTAAELAGKAPASLKIAKTTSSTMAGANASNTLLKTTTVTAFGTGYLFTATFTGFSNFFLADAGVVLPVTLLNFDGYLNNNSALLKWSTSSEQNSKNFEIEKSTDGFSYYKIGSVKAAGNSSAKLDYSFRDNTLASINYYRLRMNDNDGKNKLSQVVLIRYNDAKQNIWVVNNPFNNYLELRFAKSGNQVKLQLISTGGAIVAEKTIASPQGQLRWNVPDNLSKGNYILKAIVDGDLFTAKLVKQ